MFDDIICFDKYNNTVRAFVQWDLNQTIYIRNLGFNRPPVFQFTNQNSTTAICVQSQFIGDNVACVVPNSLLIQPYTISCFVYLHDIVDPSSGKVVGTFKLPVRPRVKPSDFWYEDDIDVIDIRALINEVKDYVSTWRAQEDTRVSNELTRVRLEEERKSAEAIRNANEASRISAEIFREDNETRRIKAEQIREDNETARQQTMSQINTIVDKAEDSIKAADAIVSRYDADLADIKKSQAAAEDAAKQSEAFVSDSLGYAIEAESYAHGNTGSRVGEDTDNAKYYSEKAQDVVSSIHGALLPKGTIRFADLASVTPTIGHMYNILDNFVTDERFKDGAGLNYLAGTNVYYTADNLWDCLAGPNLVDLTYEIVSVW